MSLLNLLISNSKSLFTVSLFFIISSSIQSPFAVFLIGQCDRFPLPDVSFLFHMRPGSQLFTPDTEETDAHAVHVYPEDILPPPSSDLTVQVSPLILLMLLPSIIFRERRTCPSSVKISKRVERLLCLFVFYLNKSSTMHRKHPFWIISLAVRPPGSAA